MTLEQLYDQSSIDLKINKDELEHESLVRTPDLFHKYSRLLSFESLRLKKLESEFKSLFLKRWEFYKGKGNAEDYSKEQFFKKIMSGDVDKYLDGDKVLTDSKKKVDYQEEVVSAILRITKQINERQWQIRNAIESMKFKAGLN